MAPSRIFDREGDTSLVRRLIALAKEEGLAEQVPGMGALEAAVEHREAGGVLSDTFDPEELNTAFHRLYRVTQRAVGSERIWNESEEDDEERPTLPPQTMHPPAIPMAVEGGRDRARLLGISASRALRKFGAMKGEEGDLDFLLRYLEGIVSSLSSLPTELIPQDYIQHVERDLVFADRLIRAEDDCDALATQVHRQIMLALGTAGKVERTMLYQLSQRIETARAQRRLAAARPLLLEAFMHSHEIIDALPLLPEREMASPKQVRAEMPTISELDGIVISHVDAGRAEFLEAVTATRNLARALLQFVRREFARQHITARLIQLDRLEDIAMQGEGVQRQAVEEQNTAIERDLRMLERIVRASRADFFLLWEEVREQMLRAVSGAVRVASKDAMLLHNLSALMRQSFETADAQQVSSGVPSDEELRMRLLEGHIYSSRMLLPYVHQKKEGGTPLPPRGAPSGQGGGMFPGPTGTLPSMGAKASTHSAMVMHQQLSSSPLPPFSLMNAIFPRPR